MFAFAIPSGWWYDYPRRCRSLIRLESPCIVSSSQHTPASSFAPQTHATESAPIYLRGRPLHISPFL
jgi:hypothetical protein